ncbi:MAG: AI-2E family transporter [candidate division NC10 bacterium]|nr:AI-2E family transporter [candidate division NC10 bacterium]
MDRQPLRNSFLFIALLLISFGLYRIFSPFLASLLWAGVLALIFFPVQQALARRFRQRSGLAAMILTLVVVLALVLPAFSLSWVLVDEAVKFYQSFQTVIQTGGVASLAEHPRLGWLKGLWFGLDAQLQSLGFDLKTLSLRGAEAMTGVLVSWLGTAARNVLAFIIDLSLMAIALFFLLRDGENLLLWLKGILPLRSEEVETIFTHLGGTIVAVVRGTLLTAGVQGLLTGFMLWVTGVPYPALLSFLSMIGAILPFGGTALVWAPAALYLALTGSWVKGIIVAAWGALVVGTSDNLLKPILISGRAALPTGLLFFGILGGLVAFGFSGLVLGPTLMTMFLACVEMFTKPATEPERGQM